MNARGVVSEPEREQRRGDHAPRRWVRAVARLTVGGAFAIVALLIGVRAWSTEAVASVVGSRAFVVTSGSMAPVFEAGDVVVVRNVPVDAISVGDIVTYDKRPGSSMVVTHRVTRIESLPGGERGFVTKGDANSTVDATPVPGSRVIGVFSHRIPRLGSFVAAYFRGPLILLFLALLLAAAALGSGKVRFRSGPPRSPSGPINKREEKKE